MNNQEITNRIVRWIYSKVREAGAKGTVVGLSGGVDSAVVAALCKKAFPEDTLGIILPCYSSEEDEKDAVLAAGTLDIPYRKVPLDRVYDSMVEALGPEKNSGETPLAYANIKPRLRMTALYFEAGIKGYLVAGTGNRSEIVIGYYTKYGDGGVDIEPVGELVKTRVRELAYFLGVPGEIIEKKPSAGLWEGQTDETEMGFTYEELDQYILTGKAKDSVRRKIEKLERISEHKRHMPPSCPLG